MPIVFAPPAPIRSFQGYFGGFGGGGGRPPEIVRGQDADMQQQALIQQSNEFNARLQFQQDQLSQGERIRMQQLQQAMGAIDADPNLTDVERADMRLQIQTGLSPLQQRAARQHLMQQEMQTKAMQQQMAQQQALTEQNAQFRARSLDQRVSVITNPDDPTQQLHMFEERPNHWAPLPWDAAGRGGRPAAQPRPEIPVAELHKLYELAEGRMSPSGERTPGAFEPLPANATPAQREQRRQEIRQWVEQRAEDYRFHLGGGQQQAQPQLPFREGDTANMTQVQQRGYDLLTGLGRRIAAGPDTVNGVSRRDAAAKIDDLQTMLARYGSAENMPPTARRVYDSLTAEVRRYIEGLPAPTPSQPRATPAPGPSPFVDTRAYGFTAS